MSIDPRNFVDFIDKVVRFRLVRMCFVDGGDQAYRTEYCIMAECEGRRCFTEPVDTLDDLKRGIVQYEGMLNFLYKNAAGYLDEDEIMDLKNARDVNPFLEERTHFAIIKDRLDEMMAMEKENYPDTSPSRGQIQAQMCWEEDEEPSYRERS